MITQKELEEYRHGANGKHGRDSKRLLRLIDEFKLEEARRLHIEDAARTVALHAQVGHGGDKCRCWELLSKALTEWGTL